MMKINGFIVKNSEGNVIGIDRTSGGYPWVPPNPGSLSWLFAIEIFESELKAVQYLINFRHYSFEPISLVVEGL